MKDRKILFWDFDGVIKETVEVKTLAFVRLFERFGPAVAARVRRHHEANGGLSRFEKIPLYLRWAGCAATAEEVSGYCASFAMIASQGVLDAAWVAGAREYLQANYLRQQFFLISATPQSEMEQILQELRIAHWFRGVYGAPTAKSDAIRAVMARAHCAAPEVLVIGDSDADHQAALANHLEFMLRRTQFNQGLQRRHVGRQCENFANE